MRHLACLTLSTLGLLTLDAHATVQITTQQQANLGFTVAADDLLQTALAGSQFTGDFARTGTAGAAALANGIYGGQGFQGPGGEAATADGSNTATFILQAGTGLGQDITAIATHAGWDGNRGGQAYTLSYATVADPLRFLPLATVFFNATTPGGNTNTRVLLTDSSGVLARQVHSLRFAFNDGLDYGFAGYREIDVFGVAAAVPEPATWALALAGAALVGLANRRAGRRAGRQPA
ncbi:PEP-CTERM sorting domain-containing protein [Pseudaquabacterium pictum]|uniref:Ice-binding protein C-terminal domain-containing protein n=1 Tax=Pseudaquabacterium pictum TaxID=2315236 RepID=A0A480AX03_9BURK|nr:PEP-CTERM sorting domain-containing protein [Rubrivivax pictus]GCL65450.1 hypothetical protein AQPW35_45310 [Rubrivivax pictus]